MTCVRARREKGISYPNAMLPKLLIIVITLNSLGSQLLLKRAVGEIGAPSSFSDLMSFFAAAAVSPAIYASLVLQVVGYAIWMVVIGHEKLGIAVAVMGSEFYVAIALLAWMIFGEELTRLQWIGVVLITVGVVCMIA